MHSKKADIPGFEFIVVLAVVIVFALIYFVWLKDFRIFGEQFSDYQICKASNIENAKLKLKINNQIIAERKGNKCKTEYITVPKDKELETIAKKLAGCWDQYLEGREELFETSDDNFCAFCSVLTFEEKKQLGGLTEYLMKTNVPGRGKKYFEYLTRTTVNKNIFQEFENSELKKLDVIDTSKPHAVIFFIGKDVNPGSLTGESNIVLGTKLGAAGFIAGFKILGAVGLCSTVVGCSAAAISLALPVGTAIGFMIGSNYDPNRETKVLLLPYTKEDLSALKCTKLEGKDRLDIKKF